MTKKLEQPSKFDRVPRRVALEADATDPVVADRAGGLYKSGLLRRVSLCSRGEALGHGFWVDQVMLQQIADLAAAAGRLKCRFAHPDWCADGTGKALGRVTPGPVEGDQVYGDLHFYAAAHNAPDGDLAGYVMDLADEDPAAFGLSIVFTHDWDAEDAFTAENTQTVELKDDAGQVIETRTQFVSPDPQNVDNLPHARIRDLYAADVVDDPAANPNGLFHRANPLASEGRGLLDYVFGRSTEAPRLSALSIAPERLRAFVSQYLATSGLSLKESTMPKPKLTLWQRLQASLSKLEEEDKKEEPGDDKKSEANDSEGKEEAEDDEEKTKADGTSEDEDKKGDGEAKEDDEEGMRSGLGKFVEMFGAERGAEYFLKPLSFEEALKAEVLSLRAQLKTADEKIATFAKLGVDPVKFSAAPKQGDPASGGEELSARERFAALNQPTKPK